MPQELRFSTLKENGAVFGNFFPPVDLDEFFPEEAEEEIRIQGINTFKEIDEISEEDVDARPGFQHLIPDSEKILEEESEDLGDEDDDFVDFVLYDLVDRFGDGDVDKPVFVNAIIQPEEKEDKKSASVNFLPFSKTKIKCEVHKRPHGKRGRNDRYKNISRQSVKNLSLSI